MKRVIILIALIGLAGLGILLIVPNLMPITATNSANPVSQTTAPSTASVNVTASPHPNQVREMKRIEQALLIPADQCKSPCFWDLQPGKSTSADFKQLALSLFKDALKEYAAPDRPLEGIDINGVAFRASSSGSPASSRTIEYVYVRINPAIAQSSALSFDNFTPSAIIRIYGNPSEAYLLFDPERLTTYRLMLQYSEKNLVYLIRGTFQNGKACLILDGTESLALYHFANAPAMEKFIKVTAARGGTLPPSIRQTTGQSASDFTKMAQNSTTNCLTVK
jgi:hypothetical protein